VSVDTWRPDRATECAVDDVLGWLAALDDPLLDGITISGGEPTDQPAALIALLSGLGEWIAEQDREIDILLYSGRELSGIHDLAPGVLELVDAVVSGPFVADLAGADALRGSSNQEVTPFTALGGLRYHAASLEADYGQQRSRMAVHVDGTSIWMVGIPLPGTMTALSDRLRERGVGLVKESWLS
jgi:anaerobic ribonucleoside-triphosphate reductase activating protein